MLMKSRAAVLTGIRQMEIREFPIPEISDEDGLLKMEVVGVCGSDPGIYRGKSKVPFPLIMGHEIVGRIVEIGEKKAKRDGVKKGDRVVVQNRFGCGKCKFCITGHYEECVEKLGYGTFVPCSKPPYLWGGYSEYLYLPPRAMIRKIDEKVPVEAAALANAVVGNGIRWVRDVGGCSIGETIVIAGCGQQGLVGTIVAKESGARVVVLGTDQDEQRLALAKEFGADYTINVNKTDALKFVRELTNGEMADLFLDVTGQVSVLEGAPDYVGTFGRIIAPGMYGPHPAKIDMDKVLMKQIRILGVHAQDHKASTAAVKLLESMKYPVEKMVTHRFTLDEAEKAVLCAGRELEGENPIKCIIAPNGFEWLK